MSFQILIKTANDWFEFSKSKTGQLDYVGKWENDSVPYALGKLFNNIKPEELSTDAEKIRKAKPKKMNYGGKLASLSGNKIVVELEL